MALTKSKLEDLISSGDINCISLPITFSFDVATGNIVITTSDDYTGATFSVNSSTGQLEVTL